MDLIKLKAGNQAGPLVQNYDSLIWTERFNSVGDFRLETGNLDFLDILPKKTVLSLRESTVPMVVESHVIERKKNSATKLIITGRDYSKILAQRQAIQSVTGALAEWAVNAKQPSDVAYFAIVKICVEGICDAKDIFPGTQVQFIAPSDYLEPDRPTRHFVIARGNLLSTVLGLLQSESVADPDTSPPSPKVEPHGIRAIRPNRNGTAIGIQIYKGVDRTDTVRFDAKRDALDDGTYTFSDVEAADSAYVLGPTGALKLRKGETDKSGLDRNVILVDGSGSGVSDDDVLKTEGARALGNAKEIAKFDGSLNQDLSPYVYNVDYGLGDVVKLVGDYGLVTPARVTEYIRSEDATGRKAYPTLVSIEEEVNA